MNDEPVMIGTSRDWVPSPPVMTGTGAYLPVRQEIYC